jgi:hypothetical protein
VKHHWLPLVIIVVAALLINGFIATVEDDLPGGFNNPHGTRTPRYASVTARVVKWGVASLLWFFAVWFLTSAFNAITRSEIALWVGFALSCLLSSLALLGSYRWALWTATLSLLGTFTAAVVARWR